MITYHNQDIKFIFSRKRIINRWIRQVVDIESNNTFFVGDIAFIFCSDKYILEINTKYLNHKHYTDVITFNNNEGNVLNADVFIGVETVKVNSELFNTTFLNELNRVIIHSILHLLGYNDFLKSDKSIMKAKEDFYLDLLKAKYDI